MLCMNCGTPLLEGETFCPNCGTPVNNDAGNAPAVNPQNPTPVMIWGIVSAACCSVPVAALILAIIARVKVNRYYAAGGLLCGQSKAGSALSKLGLALSIVLTVCWFIIIASAVVAAMTGEVDVWVDTMSVAYGF